MPEEINRLLTDAISDWLFVSERSGLANLAREGVAAEKVHFVGNVMIDTLLRFREPAAALDMPARMGLAPRDYALVTLHRPANVDEPAALSALLGPLVELGRRCPVVFPVHPRTAASLERSGADLGPGVRLVDPLGYLEFLGLMQSARLVLTDSGGIQEETTVLGVPCVTLRENTERPVTVSEGTNRLAGLRPEGIRAAIEEALGERHAPRAPELWDGAASARIAEILATSLGR
jgi:UDP-N-acetylglucosamine 2-epimerase (non-hydrolysing)